MQQTDLGDGSTSHVRRVSEVHQGYSRLEHTAQGPLFFLGGLFITTVVMVALAFGL